jgi:hypothetical protein
VDCEQKITSDVVSAVIFNVESRNGRLNKEVQEFKLNPDLGGI